MKQFIYISNNNHNRATSSKIQCSNVQKFDKNILEQNNKLNLLSITTLIIYNKKNPSNQHSCKMQQ